MTVEAAMVPARFAGACGKVMGWFDPTLACDIPSIVLVLVFVALFVALLRLVRMAFKEILFLIICWPIWKLIEPTVMEVLDQLQKQGTP